LQVLIADRQVWRSRAKLDELCSAGLQHDSLVKRRESGIVPTSKAVRRPFY